MSPTLVPSTATPSTATPSTATPSTATPSSSYPSMSPSTTFIITTVAGTGTNSFSGDAGAATSATLKNPTDVAVDSSGPYSSVYYIDTLFMTFLSLY